jgi:hypothetical protein
MPAHSWEESRELGERGPQNARARLSRQEAIDRLAAERLRELSVDEKEAILLDLWWEDDEQDEPAVAIDAFGLSHIVASVPPRFAGDAMTEAMLLSKLRRDYYGELN